MAKVIQDGPYNLASAAFTTLVHIQGSYLVGLNTKRGGMSQYCKMWILLFHTLRQDGSNLS
eukprot:15113076-Ditylum_brightwellii.AAC.1